MMKAVIAYFVFGLLIPTVSTNASERYIGLNKNMYYSCSDTLNAFDTSALSRVFTNLGMERMYKLDPFFKLGFKSKNLRWAFGYGEIKTNPQFLHPKLSDLKLDCSFNDSLIIEGFFIFVPDFKRIKKNTLKFILSAYQQEINPELKNDNALYLDLPDKNESTLIKYNWISPAYAMRYMYESNPFSSLNIGLQIGYCLLDAFGLAYVICGPIFGKDLFQKIGYPIGGLVFLAEIRWLAGMEFEREIQRYNTIRNSPYKVPVTVDFAGRLKH
jgi:hypothetical protein